MIRAKNYETMSKFVKVMTKILWPLFSGHGVHAPATGKARRPTVESLTAGTDRLSVVEDRSLCGDGMSAVRVN